MSPEKVPFQKACLPSIIFLGASWLSFRGSIGRGTTASLKAKHRKVVGPY